MIITELYKILFGRTKLYGGNVIDMSEHGRAGGTNTEQGFKYTRSADEKTLIDEADSSTTYIGRAKMGAATSDEDWQIMKVSTSGTVTTFAYADGNDDYDNEWDERANLSYS